MNKVIYWLLVVTMILNYVLYYVLVPFVWLQGKIADFNNRIDDKLLEDKFGVKMQTFVHNNKRNI